MKNRAVEQSQNAEIKHSYANVSGLKIHYSQCGVQHSDNGVIVFLHGFPEYWGTWRHQLIALGKSYHTIAPDLPGYNLSDKPSNNAFYKIENLIKVLSEFIAQVSNNQPVYLVAHDWGGAIAWPLVAFNQQLVKKLVILNAAHPSTFTREMKYNGEQRLRSGYIHQLISPQAENLLSENQFSYLFEQIMTGLAKDLVTDQLKSEYLAIWQQPGAINGMLQYYRAMPQLAADTKSIGYKDTYARDNSKLSQSNSTTKTESPLTTLEAITIPKIMIKVPTLVLWGAQDQAFVIECLDGLEDYVQDLTIKQFPDNSHWLQHEQPDAITQAIGYFVKNTAQC
ncbi:alpha/beta fold hydrolase [Thalassotalea euphylliae]|uniref:Alpha/beta hydrolase n=1 Tax=Thalassotalea euphylliae TaxID=1655234 RepID=A0A3E0UG64_9GAMM|nr:alpha/beta hydrolase [Thalassotalea euphylliae]REL35593.1 alpha/beta hydrolase [Thalassotalea euphylliae]